MKPAPSVCATDPLPPPPARNVEPTTLDAEAIPLAADTKKKLVAFAKERDEQMKTETSFEDWRDLFDRARALFCDAAIPYKTAKLITRLFSVRTFRGFNCETGVALVLKAA